LASTTNKFREEIGDVIIMERIMQIISHVMKEILRHDIKFCSKEGLTRELLRMGYPIDDIDTAFQSLYAVPLFLSEASSHEPGKISEIKRGQRIFSPDEQQKFSLSFKNEILRLSNCELLNIYETEQILIEAMQMETAEVGIRELELILHKVVKEEERLLLMLPYTSDVSMALLLN
jgi:uncharacterized protein Smg (DUF494 family)